MVTVQKQKSAGKVKRRPIKNYLATPQKSKKSPEPSLDEKVRLKAYELYQLRGCSHGCDQFDWSIAEILVNLDNQMKTDKAKKQKKADLKEIEGDIQKKAYELFERRGYAHGHSDLDWTLARELVCRQNRIASY